MSKNQKGDKFVIEIEETGEHNNYRILGYIWASTDELDKLERLDSDYINEHYGELQEEAYQEGLKAAWELATRISSSSEKGGIPIEICRELFDTSNAAKILRENTYQEALEKIEAYEKLGAFKRGDIVEFVDTDELAMYIGKYADGTHAVVFNDCNLPQKVSTDEIRKTDKHIDIQSVLEGDNK